MTIICLIFSLCSLGGNVEKSDLKVKMVEKKEEKP